MTSIHRLRKHKRREQYRLLLQRTKVCPLRNELLVVATIFLVAFLIGSCLENDELTRVEEESELIQCKQPRIIDGDTFDCQGIRIRLAGIDAPEMPGHCQQGRACAPGDPIAARDYLRSLTRGMIKCRATSIDKYGRTIGRCESDRGDLSCVMIVGGHAAKRYGLLDCE